MENTHREDILHLRERSGFILYAAERLFSNCKLVNPPFAFWKRCMEGGRAGGPGVLGTCWLCSAVPSAPFKCPIALIQPLQSPAPLQTMTALTARLLNSFFLFP